MDAAILSLFSPEEILKQLTKRASSGVLHIFTAREAANLFFHEGVIVAASKGLMEGEEVIQKALEWPDAHLIWREGEPVAAGLKPLEVNFPSFFAKLKLVSKLETGGKPGPDAKPSTDTRPLVSLPSWSASTGPMIMNKTGQVSKPGEAGKSSDSGKPFDDAPPLLPVEVKRQDLVPVTPTLSATKSIGAGAREDDSFEEALMRKHQLALVSIGGETPLQRLRIIRSSNLVGRNPACDFTLNHGSISRQHCLLQIMERGLHVKDLSTTNGTKVNGIPLTEGYVSVGDKLTIGHLDFMVEKDEPAPG